jgi:chromatin segregation and condensation protein Rec8/ScpA/Scc1 (kleisin family)
MSELLDQAIAMVRELPKDEQELAAQALLTFAELAKQGAYKLSPEARAAIEESRAQARRGEFATDEDVEAAYARFRG